MRATVTSRVVAEIYRGVEFPLGWADKPDVFNLGMARDLAVSVAAMFDADLQPVALCWCIAGREERFACAPSGETTPLLDALNDDLTEESLHSGAGDLLATMLWAPDEIRPDQGQPVQRIVFTRGRYGAGMTGWNVATRTLLASADKLLYMTRRADEALSFPAPTSLEEMHGLLGDGDSETLILLPGSVVKADASGKGVGMKMALLFGGLMVTGILICAYLLDPR